MRCFGFVSVAFLVATAPAWPADLAVPGIPNFHQVNQRLYRGGQPAQSAWTHLANIGVKIVVDLRLENEHPIQREAEEVAAAGMRYVNIPMKGIVAPTADQLAKALALLDAQDPVFIHCRRGADRTGTVIACYRILRDHWDNRKALDEAKSYGMSWMELGMKRFVLNYQPSAERAAT